jgi:hypothetical protein
MGTIQSIGNGNTIADTDIQTGQAYSTAGTNGAASGSIGISIGNSATVLTLNYKFTPANVYGNCPCTASLSPSSVSNGNYLAQGSTGPGATDGAASITWTVTSQLGS